MYIEISNKMGSITFVHYQVQFLICSRWRTLLKRCKMRTLGFLFELWRVLCQKYHLCLQVCYAYLKFIWLNFFNILKNISVDIHHLKKGLFTGSALPLNKPSSPMLYKILRPTYYKVEQTLSLCIQDLAITPSTGCSVKPRGKHNVNIVLANNLSVSYTKPVLCVSYCN